MKFKCFLFFTLSVLLGWLGAGFVSSERSAVSVNEGESSGVRLLSPEEALKSPRSPEDEGDGFAAQSELLLRLDSASVSELRRWLGSLSKEDRELKAKIVSRWAELDPKGAMLAIKSGELDEGYRGSVLTALAKVDLEMAVDEALLVSGYSEIYGIVRGAGEEQIERLYELLIEKGLDKTDPNKFQYIFSQLAAVDPMKAANLALEFSNGNQVTFESGLNNVLGVWLKDDSAGALAWAESLEGSEKRVVFEKLASKWMEMDTLEALQKFGDKIDFSKIDRHGSNLGNLPSEKFQQILDWIDGDNLSSNKQRAHLAEILISGLGSGKHPERLEDLVSRIGDEKGSGNLEWSIKRAVGEWVSKDEAGVTRFINSIEDEKMRNYAIEGILGKWSQSDPLRALDFMKSLGGDIPKLDANSLVSGLMRGDLSPVDAMDKIPESMREGALVNFGMTVGENSPVEVIAYLESQPESVNREQGMAFASGQWGRTDPLAASQWVSDLEPGDTREWAAANVLGGWAATDFDAAVAWAQGLDDKSKSRALAKAAEIAVGRDPVQSIEIAAEIKDERMQTDALKAGLEALARSDPDKAGELLRGVNLKENVQAQIEKAIEQARALNAYLETQR